jgi:spermidine synthase
MKLRYYTTDIHKAAFALPAFVVDALDNAENNS